MSEEPEADYGAIGDVGDDGGEDFDADLAAMEAMQAEAENENSALQENVSSAMASATEVLADKEAKDRERAARDEKSVFVTNVHWEAKGEQVAEYFSSCGPVERVTIQQDKHGNAKGTCYVEFSSVDAVSNALILSHTTFLNREIVVVQKRTNLPSFMLAGGRGRGRGGAMDMAGGRGGRGAYRGRGGRGGFMGMPMGFMMPHMMMPSMMMGGMGGFGFRGRGRGAPRARGRGRGGAA